MKNITQGTPLGDTGSFAAEYKFYTYDVGNLEGKILTLIDASIADKEQKQAMKDMARQIIWDWVFPKNTAQNTSDSVNLPRGNK